MMKKQIRILLLFALTIALLLGALALVPFSASAADMYFITVKSVDMEGKTVSGYGTVLMNGENPRTAVSITYQAEAGSSVTLTVTPNDGYTFLGWSKESPPVSYEGDGDTYTFDMQEENTTLYAVFERGVYNIYYVGANGSTGIPDAVMEQYGTDVEYHPSYNKPANPSKHYYGTATTPPAATVMAKDTHTFLGWKAYYADGEEIALQNGKIPSDASGTIYLVPQWQPVSCEATRVDLVGTTELGRSTGTANYGKVISGKDFGAEASYTGYRFDDTNPANYTEATVALDGTTVVYRYYTPCEYQVTFNLNAPDEDAVTARGAEEITAVFMADLPEHIDVPACTGWDFLGYYLVQASGSKRLYYDASGNIGTIKRWTYATDKTLTAEWKLQEHNVIVHVMDADGNDCGNDVEVLINGNANPGAMEYGTQGTVTVSVLPNQAKKMTAWNGVAIDHTTTYSGSFTIGEEDVEFTVLLLPTELVPALNVDYTNEKLEGFLPGVYQITLAGETWQITVAENGSISVPNFSAAEAVSVSGLLGSEIQIVRLGDPGKTADSNVQTLAISARPAPIAAGDYAYEIVETKQERSITLRGNGVYELAYTTADNEEPTNWTAALRMENLEIGTPYTVYLRVRATANAPHSEATKVLENVEFSHLVNLKPLFIILLCLLALQILALTFLLISRHRARMNAVAAPLVALLAVKTIPAGLFPWIIVLIVAVVALQVILVCLSLQTGIIWEKRTKKPKNKKEDGEAPAAPAEFTLFGDAPKQEPQPQPTEADRSEEQPIQPDDQPADQPADQPDPDGQND